MLIAQITDTHIKPGRKLAYRRVDTAGFLEAAVRHVNAFVPTVDVVMFTGDLVDLASREEYAIFRDIVDGLEVPWYVLPGNHDDPAVMMEVFADRPYVAGLSDFFHYVIEDYPVRLVALDTVARRKPFGQMCDARLAWLDGTLAAEPTKPTMIFQHHPPFRTGVRHMDVQNLLDTDALLGVLAKHGQVRHVACGHVHRASETTIGGIGFSIAPSPAHAVTLDLVPDAPPSYTMDPPAVRLFNVAVDGAIASHLSYVGDFDGPHPFFNADGSLID